MTRGRRMARRHVALRVGNMGVVNRLPADLAARPRFAQLMDEAFVIPGTKQRFGIDAVAGLIPVVGHSIDTGKGRSALRSQGRSQRRRRRSIGPVAYSGASRTPVPDERERRFRGSRTLIPGS